MQLLYLDFTGLLRSLVVYGRTRYKISGASRQSHSWNIYLKWLFVHRITITSFNNLARDLLSCISQQCIVKPGTIDWLFPKVEWRHGKGNKSSLIKFPISQTTGSHLT